MNRMLGASADRLLMFGVIAGVGLLLVIVLAERAALLATLREIRDLPEREVHGGTDG